LIYLSTAVVARLFWRRETMDL